MLAHLQNAAENYSNGLTTADEFLGRCITAIGERYTALKPHELDGADPRPLDPALDVDALATALRTMKLV